MSEDIRSVQMSIIDDKIFQCAQSTCLPFENLTISNIRYCEINCLNRIQCMAITFHKSNLQCQLFDNLINQNANMSYEMNAVTMISIFGTRYPPDLTSTSTASTSTSTSTSTTSTSTSTTTSKTSTTSTSTSTSTTGM
ncbi:unnamed protein product [Adineta ricciae]|uniref:Apple domain-containing protein n=1 Tax=Adineta ricciae TaxID=249248 RepID=A0A816FX11_ADIRI|nr:unnamed protein product [Adineta ricciae]CAF1667244.1 unnamed protein product [Adineta ricciae]